MPSAACTICSECLELDHQVVSACTCGHVYHEACLLRWLDTSATCPICRIKATKRSLVKLFFESADDNDSSQDPAKLKNALSESQLRVNSLTKERGTLYSETERLSTLVDSLNGRVKIMTKQCNQEQTITDALKRQLSMLRQENDQVKEYKKETKKLKEKVNQLLRFERILTENTAAVEDMIKERGEYQSTKELASYCVAIKHEFESIKLTRRSLREEIDKLRKDNSGKTRQLMDSHRDQEHLLKTNQSLKEEVLSLLEEKQHMKAKMKTLVQAMNGSPSILLSTPKLVRPKTGQIDIVDCEDSPIQDPGCPDTPELIGPGPSTQVKKTCKEFDISYVKTTSKSKKAVIRTEERIALQSLANSSLFVHGRMNKTSSGKIVKGFDGLGGHRSFIRTEAMKRSLPASMQLMVKKRKVNGGLPAYPTMDSFLT